MSGTYQPLGREDGEGAQGDVEEAPEQGTVVEPGAEEEVAVQQMMEAPEQGTVVEPGAGEEVAVQQMMEAPEQGTVVEPGAEEAVAEAGLGPDAEPESDPEQGTTVVDSGAEEVVAEAQAEANVEPDAEPELDAERQEGAGPDAEPEPDAEKDTLPAREPDAEPDAEQGASDETVPLRSSTQESSEAMSSEPSASDSWLPAIPDLPGMPSLTLPDVSSLLDAFPRELPAIPSIADLTGTAAPAQDGAAPGPDSEESRLPPGATEAEQKANTLGRADQQMPVGTQILVAERGRGECVGFERSWFGPNMHLIRFTTAADTKVAEGVPPEPQPPTGVGKAAAAEGATAAVPSQEQLDAVDQAQTSFEEEAEKMVDEAPPSGGVSVALSEVRWTVFACEFEGFEETVREAETRAKVHSLAENPSGTVGDTAEETTSSPAADAVAQMTPEQKAAAAQSLAQQQGRADQAMAIGTPIYVAGKGRGIYSGFVRNWVGANHHTIKFRAGVDESEVLAEVTETLSLQDCCWTAIEAKMAVGGRLATLADMTRVPQTMIALEDCIVRAAADKSSEALWTLSAGEVIEVLRAVTVPATSSSGGGSTEDGSELLSTLQEVESGNAVGANSVERVFFSQPDLGLDGWVSTSTSGADGTVRPLLEQFKGDSLTMEYEDIPGAEASQQSQEPEAQGQTQKQLDTQQEPRPELEPEPDAEPEEAERVALSYHELP